MAEFTIVCFVVSAFVILLRIAIKATMILLRDRNRRLLCFRNEREAVEFYAALLFPEYITEAMLFDGSRADIMTATHVIEADWDGKSECIAQSLRYAELTGMEPGILILDTGKKPKMVQDALMAANRAGISAWIVPASKAK